jgi:hypothetical protein
MKALQKIAYAMHRQPIENRDSLYCPFISTGKTF